MSAASILAVRLYLDCLRTADHRPVEWRRMDSQSRSDDPGPVDRYELTHFFGKVLGEVFILPYQQRISERAPEGLLLAQWPLGATNPRFIISASFPRTLKN